jgi:predicted RNA-binding protein YlqC (UPF0109 family)
MLHGKNIPKRIVIYPRDIENITGRKGRTAQRLHQTIRQVFEKEKFQFITVEEFCAFTGIDEETVRSCMLD